MTEPERKDVCYGPIAPGQYFVCRLNPDTPQTWKATGVLTDGVLVCEVWGMAEHHGEWSFRRHDGGYQVAVCSLERMERVTKAQAREYAVTELRRRDDDWRARWAPTREPLKIVRCTCGVGDDAETTRHTAGCPHREDW